MQTLAKVLKILSDPTRLRLLFILNHCELTVSELVQITRQSQPRISRHLKLLHGAGLIERFQEGSFVFYRLTSPSEQEEWQEKISDLICSAMEKMTSNDVIADMQGLKQIRQERYKTARGTLVDDEISEDEKKLTVDDAEVDKILLGLLDKNDYRLALDLGTGRGDILRLYADKIQQGIGFDSHRKQVMVARLLSSDPGFKHLKIRQADILNLPLHNDEADLITLCYVLRYIENPLQVLKEAARVLTAGGQMVIIDNLPHEFKHLQSRYHHKHLGFSDSTIGEWCKDCGLTVETFKKLNNPDGISVGIWSIKK